MGESIFLLFHSANVLLNLNISMKRGRIMKYQEQIEWNDAIYFCNKFSEMCGLEPVYSVDGTTDVTKWGFDPQNKIVVSGKIIENNRANGFKLPKKSSSSSENVLKAQPNEDSLIVNKNSVRHHYIGFRIACTGSNYNTRYVSCITD